MKRHIFIFIMITLTTFLSSCTDSAKKSSFINQNEFKGLLFTDEENALKSGGKILYEGGNAADSAIATMFTLGLTLPSRASYAGMGVCKAYNKKDKTVNVYDFRKPNTFIKAMILLQANEGSLRLNPMVAIAEAKANFGFKPDDILLNDIKKSYNTPSLFKVAKDDTLFYNQGLAELLTNIRLDALKGYYNPEVLNALGFKDKEALEQSPEIIDGKNFSETPRLNEALTDFAVIDKDGNAVACSLSMGKIFGSGKVSKNGVLTAVYGDFSPALDFALDDGDLVSITTSNNNKISCEGADNLSACTFEIKNDAYEMKVTK